MTVVSHRNLHPASRQGSSDVGLTAAVTLFAALLVALVTRGNIVVGLVVLFLVFVPLERIFALHARRVFRPGIVTDLRPAAARLHPIDSAFTQAFTVLPLLLLGYDAGVFASIAVFVTLLAIFQHANVRLRFPGVRWIVNTPEWHHWHHARDPEARNKNFGLPVVDNLFGTAYLPKARRPAPRSRRRARRYCTRPSSSRSNTSRTRPLSASTVVPS